MSGLPYQDRLFTSKSISAITGESEGSSRRKLAAGVYGPALAPGTIVRGWAIRASVFWAHIEALETEPEPRLIPPELKVDKDIRERLEGRSRNGKPVPKPGRKKRTTSRRLSRER